jgi:two-component system LytT family sensor kinase
VHGFPPSPAAGNPLEGERYPARWMQLTVGIWSLAFLFFGAFTLSAHWADPPQWLVPWLIVIVAIGVGFSILLSRITLWAGSKPGLQQAAILTASVLAVAAAQSVLDHLLLNMLKSLIDGEDSSGLVSSIVLNLLIYLWIFGIYCLGLKMLLLFRNARKREAELARARATANRAELAILRYQVQPDVLFATLNSAAEMVDAGQPDEAEALIARLSSFMRGQLATDIEGPSTLGDELDAIDSYIALERTRIGMEIELHTECPDMLEDLSIPPFVIQPLIEMRVVRRAEEQKSGTFRIFIRAVREGDALIVTVRDNGPPLMREERAEIFERLRLSSEGQSKLDMPRNDIVFFARLELPLRPLDL